MKTLVGILVMSAILIAGIEGHGMLLDPPGRSSRWRSNSSALKNYDDNANYCGGFAVQWSPQNGGKCGFCGDAYSITPPRPNELGGLYGGDGVIVKTYKNVNTAEVEVVITANHLGYIYFNLCNMDEFKKESEECYYKIRLKLVDGSDKYYIDKKTGSIKTTIVWPKGLSCKHCILRWTYNAGNNWGTCENGKGAMGCGAQENFKSCADITIY